MIIFGTLPFQLNDEVVNGNAVLPDPIVKYLSFVPAFEFVP